MRAYGPSMQGQMISGHVVCPHCLVRQPQQACTTLPRCSASRVQHRVRAYLCTRAAKEEANSSAEDLLQDSRAEVRRRRRESRQAIESEVEPTVEPTDEPTFDIDPADIEMMTENAQLELDDFRGPEEPQKSDAQRQEEELMGRKSALILQLSSAGAELDSLIDENKHEIDEVLLDLLESRTEAAIEMEEEESAIEGLMLLWRRLHAEMQRNRATPATRLLDDVLRAMNPASQLDFSDRQEVAETLLHRGFSSPGSGPIDIFGVAAALAEGQEIAGNFEEDFVPRETFLQEARELLQGALEAQEELERGVKSGEAKDHQEEANELIRSRRVAIMQLQEIIALAKSIKL
ncbi:hypothetical protein ABBQ38_004033 [Trebouxia sp. C0009 RCD-2024]